MTAKEGFFEVDRKGWRPALILILEAGLALAVIVWGTLAALVCVSAAREYPAQPADCVVVLGAHVNRDGTMSNSLLFRCQAALSAWREGRAPALILCGGKGPDEPEAQAKVMARWMIGQGVPESALFLEDRSHDTRQNLANARAIMAREGFGSCAICTSDYHLPRALWLARDAGLDASAIPAASPESVTALVRSRAREALSWALYGLRRLLGR